MKWKTLGKSGPTLILKDGVNLDCWRKVAFQRRKIALKKGTEIKINVSQGWGRSVSQSCSRWEPGMWLVKVLLVASCTRTELLVPLVTCFVELVVMAWPEFLTEEMASDSYPHWMESMECLFRRISPLVGVAQIHPGNTLATRKSDGTEKMLKIHLFSEWM